MLLPAPSPSTTPRQVFLEALLHEFEGRPLVTVAEAARALRVEPSYLYARQRVLGAARLSEGPRAPIRFFAHALAERLAAIQAPASSAAHRLARAFTTTTPEAPS